MEKDLSLYVTDKKSKRIDAFIAEKAKISRSFCQKLIDDEMVSLNDKCPKHSDKVKEGDIIHVRIPIAKETEIEKQDIPLDIIYEDDDILVINKIRGMVVHPSAGHENGTMVNALMYHVGDLSGIGGEERPGIVHRLDKNTSGLLVIAKNDKAHQKLSSMFQKRTIRKEYLAVVHGKLRGPEGIINLPIGRDPKDRKLMAVGSGGKNAVTRWKVRKTYDDFSLVSLFPETGRTHQIRVHLKHIGNAVIGDPEYGRGAKLFDIEGQALHSHRISFNHPITNKPMEFEAPIPEDIEEILHMIEKSERNSEGGGQRSEGGGQRADSRGRIAEGG